MRAARIGPTVCELDGPMPILNRSKTLIATPYSVGRDHGRVPARVVGYGSGESGCVLCQGTDAGAAEGAVRVRRSRLNSFGWFMESTATAAPWCR